MVAHDPAAQTRQVEMPAAAASAPGTTALALRSAAPDAAPLAAPQARPLTYPMTRQGRQQELAALATAKACMRRDDEAALTELKELGERGETLAPERAWELTVKAITSAIANPDSNHAALPVLVNTLQAMAPATYASLVTRMVRNGCFQALMSNGADQVTVQAAMLLRAELVGELGLSTCSEFMTLDSAMRHWVEAQQAMAKAQRASKATDYSRYAATAQASDKVFTTLIQQLRTRHQPRVATLHVGHATTLAIQVNEGGPPAGGDASRTKHVPSRQVAEVPAARALPRYFDKTD